MMLFAAAKSELATCVAVHVAAVHPANTNVAVSALESAVHTASSLPEYPLSQVTATVWPVVAVPVPLPLLLSELAGVMAAHVAATQLTVVSHDDVVALPYTSTSARFKYSRCPSIITRTYRRPDAAQS
jgi:hypothetical protein